MRLKLYYFVDRDNWCQFYESYFRGLINFMILVLILAFSGLVPNLAGSCLPRLMIFKAIIAIHGS